MRNYLKKLILLALIMGFWQEVAGETLKSAFISISARTPRILPNDIDMEFKGGLSTKFGDIWGKHEREDGNIYRGLSIKTAESKVKTPKYDLLKLADGISAELLYDESRPVNEAFIYKKLAGWNVFQVRMSNMWIEGLYQGVLLGVKLNIDYNGVVIKANYDTDALDNHIGKVRLSYKYNLGKFYIEPFIVYENRNALIFWQAKTEFGISF